MYAAIRAKPGDHLVNRLIGSDDYEVVLTPEAVRDDPNLQHIRPGFFSLLNLRTTCLEWHALSMKGWILL